MTPDLLAEIHQLAFTDSRSWSADEFRSLLESPHCFAVGGDDAFALGRAIADEAELLTIATRPQNQRQGLGRSTLAAYEAEATTRGAAFSFLEVASDNAAALALYQSCGYGPDGCRKGYYRRSDGSVADALLMRKQIG